MNVCVEHHTPKFQITYRPAKGCNICPVWLVCESCMTGKECFGSHDEIESVEVLA